MLCWDLILLINNPALKQAPKINPSNAPRERQGIIPKYFSPNKLNKDLKSIFESIEDSAIFSIQTLHDLKLVSIIPTVLFVLYGFLYINLQLQDYALLFGSFGLFITLTALMFFTRNIDWFTVLKSGNK